MSRENLGIYLNDHVAGSVIALEMLDRLSTTYRDSELGHAFHLLRDEILADRRELDALLERLHIGTSTPRKALAWMTEKLVEWKMVLDDEGKGKLALFETLEALSLGIEGKLALWRALGVVGLREITGLDLQRLQIGAIAQRARVEDLRLRFAKVALSETT